MFHLCYGTYRPTTNLICHLFSAIKSFNNVRRVYAFLIASCSCSFLYLCGRLCGVQREAATVVLCYYDVCSGSSSSVRRTRQLRLARSMRKPRSRRARCLGLPDGISRIRSVVQSAETNFALPTRHP